MGRLRHCPTLFPGEGRDPVLPPAPLDPSLRRGQEMGRAAQNVNRHPELDSGSTFFLEAAVAKVDAGSSPA